MKLDERTFGDSPAAIKLAQIINENNLDSSRVSKFLQKFNERLKSINHLDKDMANYLGQLIFKEMSKYCTLIPKPLNTYTHNVMCAKYRDWIKTNIK